MQIQRVYHGVPYRTVDSCRQNYSLLIKYEIKACLLLFFFFNTEYNKSVVLRDVGII